MNIYDIIKELFPDPSFKIEREDMFNDDVGVKLSRPTHTAHMYKFTLVKTPVEHAKEGDVLMRPGRGAWVRLGNIYEPDILDRITRAPYPLFGPGIERSYSNP